MSDVVTVFDSGGILSIPIPEQPDGLPDDEIWSEGFSEGVTAALNLTGWKG